VTDGTVDAEREAVEAVDAAADAAPPDPDPDAHADADAEPGDGFEWVGEADVSGTETDDRDPDPDGPEDGAAESAPDADDRSAATDGSGADTGGPTGRRHATTFATDPMIGAGIGIHPVPGEQADRTRGEAAGSKRGEARDAWSRARAAASADDGSDWGRRLRRARLGLGVAALVAGAALIVVPWSLPAAAGLATTEVETAAGAVGALAVFQALLAAVRLHRGGDADEPAFPDDEPGSDREVDAPGVGLDGLLDEYHRLDPETREAVRSRIRQAAVDTLREEGYGRAAAEAALADGSWTGDVGAAAYLGDVRVPWQRRLREWLAAGSTGGGRAERAVEAVWRRRTGAPPGTDRDPLDGLVGGSSSGGSEPGSTAEAGPGRRGGAVADGGTSATDGGADAVGGDDTSADAGGAADRWDPARRRTEPAGDREVRR